MKRLLLFAVLPLFLAAQTPAPTLTLSTASASVKPGAPITFGVTLSNSSGANLAALQWTIPFPNSSLTWATGAAAITAGKNLQCSSASFICVLVGMNQTPLTDGVIATFTWTPLSPGSYTYNLSNQMGASDAAKALSVPLSVGAAVALLITSPCDINGDGKIDLSDITSYLDQFVFSAPQAGVVNPIASGYSVVDVQRIATAGTSGGSCITGP